MLLIREVMHCKPGKVRPMVEKFLAMAKLNEEAGLGRMRVMTDFCAERYWTIVAEFEVPSLQAFEEMMQGAGITPELAKEFDDKIGVTGVVLPRHRAVHITPTVAKAAQGEFLTRVAELPVGEIVANEDVRRVFRDEAFTTRNYDWQLEPVHGRTILQLDGREHAVRRLFIDGLEGFVHRLVFGVDVDVVPAGYLTMGSLGGARTYAPVGDPTQGHFVDAQTGAPLDFVMSKGVATGIPVGAVLVLDDRPRGRVAEREVDEVLGPHAASHNYDMKLEDIVRVLEALDKAGLKINPAKMATRTPFAADALDSDSHRPSIQARQGFRVFLNGHEIHTWAPYVPADRSLRLWRPHRCMTTTSRPTPRPTGPSRRSSPHGSPVTPCSWAAWRRPR